MIKQREETSSKSLSLNVVVYLQHTVQSGWLKRWRHIQSSAVAGQLKQTRATMPSHSPHLNATGPLWDECGQIAKEKRPKDARKLETPPRRKKPRRRSPPREAEWETAKSLRSQKHVLARVRLSPAPSATKAKTSQRCVVTFPLSVENNRCEMGFAYLHFKSETHKLRRIKAAKLFILQAYTATFGAANMNTTALNVSLKLYTALGKYTGEELFVYLCAMPF